MYLCVCVCCRMRVQYHKKGSVTLSALRLRNFDLGANESGKMNSSIGFLVNTFPHNAAVFSSRASSITTNSLLTSKGETDNHLHTPNTRDSLRIIWHNSMFNTHLCQQWGMRGIHTNWAHFLTTLTCVCSRLCGFLIALSPANYIHMQLICNCTIRSRVMFYSEAGNNGTMFIYCSQTHGSRLRWMLGCI